MIRSEFRFSLEPFARYAMTTDPGYQKWLKPVTRSVQPSVDHHWGQADFVIDLDSPKLPELVLTLEQLRKDKVAKPGSVYLTQSLLEDVQTPIEWFRLSEDVTQLEFGRRCSYWLHAVRADRMKPGVHVASGRFGCAVSERFKQAVENHRLSGLDFIWIPDESKHRALQWYLPLARDVLGRGLDHPWFDRNKLNKHPTHQYEGERRFVQSGCNWFFRENFRDNPDFGGPNQKRLFSLFGKSHICVVSFPTVLRRHLPRTDFAFLGGERDGWGEYSGQKCKDSDRILCVNRKSRDLLVAAKVCREGDWSGIRVVDRPYRGAAVLDKLYPDPPLPLFDDAELRWIRSEEAKEWGAFVQAPKAVLVPSLARSLALLKARKQMGPAKLGGRASTRAIAQANKSLPRRLPAAWERVLRTANGGVVDDCELANGLRCAIPSTEELPKFHQEQMAAAKCLDPKFPDHFLHVVQSEHGDYICLNLKKERRDGDCPALLISHETGEVERQWDSVASFLEELLASETG